MEQNLINQKGQLTHRPASKPYSNLRSKDLKPQSQLQKNEVTKSKDNLSANRLNAGAVGKNTQRSLISNPSLTSLTMAQNQKIKNTMPTQKSTANLKKAQKSEDKSQSKAYAQIHKQPVNIVSSTGGHSFLRMNNNLASQNSNISNNNLVSTGSAHDNSELSSLRKSPTAAQIFHAEKGLGTLLRDPSANNLKQMGLKTQIIRPTSGRPQINKSKQASFDKTTSIHQTKHPLLQSIEQISINLQTGNHSLSSSVQRNGENKGMNSQKFKMLQQISQQATNIQFSKTLRGFQFSKDDKSSSQLENDYTIKEQQLSSIHNELRSKSIEQFTDQLMLKDKEISTLKKQMEILRQQLIQQQQIIENQQSEIDQLTKGQQQQQTQIQQQQQQQKNQIYQEVIEERKSDSKQFSFEDSELQAIQQNEDPYIEINKSKKTLQRSNGNKTGSQQIEPMRGLVRCGNSQLNNKLGKTKSTADLFGDIKQRLKGGETIQDFIMNQKQKEIPNLEEIIRESIIEGSQNTTTVNNQLVNQTIDSKIDDQDLLGNEKSLSLDDDKQQSEKMLDELFNARDTKFNESVLDKLVNQSDVFTATGKKQQQGKPKEINEDNIVLGMNEEYYHQQIEKEDQFSPTSDVVFNNGYNFFNNIYSDTKKQQNIFDVESNYGESLANNGESRQIIIRNEDSFTSKQTNEYLTDLLAKHHVKNNEEIINRPSVQIGQQLQWCDSPMKSRGSNSSNETARLSFSKENNPDFEDVVVNTQFSGSNQNISKKVQFTSPKSNIILQAQSIQSISELLKENTPRNFHPNIDQQTERITMISSNKHHQNDIHNINFALKKKSIEFSSPVAMNLMQKKLQNANNAANDIQKPRQGLSRDKSKKNIGNAAMMVKDNNHNLLETQSKRNLLQQLKK